MEKSYYFPKRWGRAVMHSNSDKIESTSCNDANEVVKLFQSLR